MLFRSKPKGKKCEGIKGIIAECQEWMDQELEPELLDVVLIGSAQRVEHYEIAAYGCACVVSRRVTCSVSAAASMGFVR